MKKIVVLMLCLVMALGTMSNVYAAGIFDEAVKYNFGETVNSAITADDKHDEYEITLPESGVVTFKLTSNIDKITMKLFDPDEFELWRNIPTADANGQVVVDQFICLTGGTYYLQVAQAYQGGLADYSLTVTFDPAGEDFPETIKENNNSAATANQIQLNKVYAGFIANNDVTDLYKVSVDTNTKIVVVSQSSSIFFEVGKWHEGYGWNNETKLFRRELQNFPQTGEVTFSLANPSGPQYDHYAGKYYFYVTNGNANIEGIEKMDSLTPLHQATGAAAAEPETTTPVIPDISVRLNDKPIAFDQLPIIEEGRTLVPLRAIFEALGATVDWKEDTQTVTAVKGDITISLQIGSTDMFVNGTAKVLDVPAKIINSRTLVPVRAISEAFGCEVKWDGKTRTVLIIAK